MVESRIKSIPDEELQYRSQEVKANNKTVITPIKSIDPSKMPMATIINEKVGYINELYARLSKERIYKHMTGSNDSLIYKLNQLKKKSTNSANSMQFCFLEFKDNDLPAQKEIEYMTDQAYVYSDITPIPILSKFVDRITDVVVDGTKKTYTPNEAKFERVKKYIIGAIDTITQLNSKPIMGYIPDYRYYFDELVKIYVDRGINTFYYDAHLSNPVTLQGSLRAFMRELNKQEMLEKSFVHMINPGYGRGIKDSSMIPAKDILGFGLGIDSLGERHMSPRYAPQVYENMAKNPDNKYRLFIKNSYGYLRTVEKEEIKTHYPNDSQINVLQFLKPGKSNSKIQNAFNVEQLALESAHLKNNIVRSEPILQYIDKKSNIGENDIKLLRRSKINQKK